MATTVNGTTGVSLIQDGVIALADLSATGTASSSTFLRGDNAWATPGGGGLTQLASFATTSGTTVVSPTLNLSTYKYLYIWLVNVSFTSDTGGDPTITPNGGSATSFVAGTGLANSYQALTMVDLATGISPTTYYAGAASTTTKDFAGGGSGWFINSGISTATTSLSFTSPSGGNFDLGSIRLYGLK